MEKQENKKDTVVLYHASCLDGFSGAWVAWKKLGDNAIYIPLHHNTPLPQEVEGRNVYLIDFAYTDQPTLDTLFKKAKKVVLIDHHITTKPILNQFEEYSFDLNHSGAVLAWKYFYPQKTLPKMLSYVEAIDLGRFNEINAKEADQSIKLYERDFEVWSNLIRDFDNTKKHLDHINIGKILIKKLDKEIQKIASLAEDVVFEGIKCKMVNTPIHVSYVGGELYLKHPPVSIMWSRRGKIVVFSLRSDGSVDVAKIAQKYGGGGHKQAAAFRWETDALFDMPKIQLQNNGLSDT